MPNKPSVSIHWFRRDLRLDDNAALYHALSNKFPVVGLFIFDKAILDHLEDKCDKRVTFIHDQLLHLQEELKKWGSSLDVRYGAVAEVWENICKDYDVQAVFTNQ